MRTKYQLLLKSTLRGNNQLQEISRELEATGWKPHNLAGGDLLFVSNRPEHKFKDMSSVTRYLKGYLSDKQLARLEIVQA